MNDLIINTGDVLIRSYGIYDHVGIADGFGFVYENSRDRSGRGKVSLKEFADDEKVKNVGILGDLSPSEIISRAETLVKDKKKYQLFSNNCEHFIREVCDVNVTSPQIQAKFISVGFFALACYAKNPIVRNTAIGIGLITAFTKDENNLLKHALIFAGAICLTALLVSK